MTRKSILVVLFGFFATVSNTTIAQQFELLFFDDFNAENSGIGQLNFSSFTNWQVVSGSVDLIGAGTEFDFLPGNGLYVDLDGTTNKAGTLESNPILTVGGDHVVQFFLAGSQRGSGSDFVEVFFNELSLAALELPSNQPFVLYSFNVFVPSGSTPTLRFEHTGNDNIGLLLDRVSVLREIPFTGCLIEPETAVVDAGSLHEFVVTSVKDGRSATSPEAVVLSVEVVEGPNEGLRVPRAGGSRFQYQGFPTSSADTDTIRATVQIDGDRYTCDGTVKWGTFAPACLAGNDNQSGRRHVLVVNQASADWTVCGVPDSVSIFGEYTVDRHGRPIFWKGVGFNPEIRLHVDFDGLQPTKMDLVIRDRESFIFIPINFGNVIRVEDDERPCKCD